MWTYEKLLKTFDSIWLGYYDEMYDGVEAEKMVRAAQRTAGWSEEEWDEETISRFNLGCRKAAAVDTN